MILQIHDPDGMVGRSQDCRPFVWSCCNGFESRFCGSRFQQDPVVFQTASQVCLILSNGCIEVPKLNGLVIRNGQHNFALKEDGNSVNARSVTFQGSQKLTRFYSPDFDCAIRRSGNDAISIGRYLKVIYLLAVSEECRQLIS